MIKKRIWLLATLKVTSIYFKTERSGGFFSILRVLFLLLLEVMNHKRFIIL